MTPSEGWPYSMDIIIARTTAYLRTTKWRRIAKWHNSSIHSSYSPNRLVYRYGLDLYFGGHRFESGPEQLLSWSYCWFTSVPAGKWRDSTSTRPPLPSKSIRIYQWSYHSKLYSVDTEITKSRSGRFIDREKNPVRSERAPELPAWTQIPKWPARSLVTTLTELHGTILQQNIW
jgi:hypothetical protein